MENPEYAWDCGIDNVKWHEIRDILKAMWRKFQDNKDNRKQKERYQHLLAYSQIIYKSYQ